MALGKLKPQIHISEIKLYHFRTNSLACKNPYAKKKYINNVRKKRNINPGAECVGEASISRSTSTAVVELVAHPDDSRFSSTICQGYKAGYDLIQLTREYEDYDGCK